MGRKDTEDGTNAKFLTKECALLTNENTYLETYEELFLSESGEGTLHSFCYAFTAANIFSKVDKMHTLRVNMGDFYEIEICFSLLTVLCIQEILIHN